jgi:archaemetzincin
LNLNFDGFLDESRNITLISFGHFERDFIEEVANAIRQEFLCKVNYFEGHIDLSEYYDPRRRQYDGTKLLKSVDLLSPSESVKTIGMFNIDLFIPILTYIFGQAYLGGKSGIASVYRLKNELYGMRQDERLLRDRFRKVCIHELGHSFGLVHCNAQNCVMKSSTYVEDIDLKEQTFCNNCRKELGLV